MKVSMYNPYPLKNPWARSLRGASVANGLCTASGHLLHLYQYHVTKTVSAVQNADQRWHSRD